MNTIAARKNIINSNLKSSRLDYALVVIGLIYSARSIPFFGTPISVILPLVLALIVYYLKNKHLYRTIKSSRTFLVFTFLMIAYIIKFRSVDPMFILYHFGLLFIAYLIISSNGRNFIIHYENIVYKLAVISLVFFPFQLLFPQAIFNLLNLIQSVLGFHVTSESYSSILIYTFNQDFNETARNCGFSWEPGPYAIFLLLAILFRLMSNQLKIDKHIVIFITAMITTFSTTGILGLLVIIGWYFYNKRKQIFIVILPVIIGISIFLFTNVDFLGAKITSQYSSAQAEVDAQFNNKQEKNISIGRFSGFLLNWGDFKRNPILGYGGHIKEETEAAKMGKLISSTSGLGNWMAQFGVIGLIILLITHIRSQRKLHLIFNLRGSGFVVLTILMLGFGFNLLVSPIFFCLMLFDNFYISR
jgi:hypothetical protein